MFHTLLYSRLFERLIKAFLSSKYPFTTILTKDITQKSEIIHSNLWLFLMYLAAGNNQRSLIKPNTFMRIIMVNFKLISRVNRKSTTVNYMTCDSVYRGQDYSYVFKITISHFILNVKICESRNHDLNF